MAKKPPMGHDPLAWMSEVETPVLAENNDEIEPDTVKTQEDSAPVQPSEANDVKQQNSALPTEPINEKVDMPLSRSWITVELDDTLTLSTLPQLHEKLCEYKGKRIELVGDQVTRIDTAALQLLFAFISSSDITVSWKNQPSDEIINAAHLLGLSQQLSLQPVE